MGTTLSRLHFDRLRGTVGEVLAEWQLPSEDTTRAVEALADLRRFGPEVAPQVPPGVIAAALADVHGRAVVLMWLTRLALLNDGDRHAATDLFVALGEVAESTTLQAAGFRVAHTLSHLFGLLQLYMLALTTEATADASQVTQSGNTDATRNLDHDAR